MADCPVCKTPIEVFKVYSHAKKKFTEMNGVCIPCKEKADRERLQNLPSKQH